MIICTPYGGFNTHEDPAGSRSASFLVDGGSKEWIVISAESTELALSGGLITPHEVINLSVPFSELENRLSQYGISTEEEQSEKLTIFYDVQRPGDLFLVPPHCIHTTKASSYCQSFTYSILLAEDLHLISHQEMLYNQVLKQRLE